MSEVDEFLKNITNDKRRADAVKINEIMKAATGLKPEMQGNSIVGFGSYHYEYASGRKGDVAAASFSPRKDSLTIYIMDGVKRYEKDLAKLGPHKSAVGCIYIKDLDKIDTKILKKIISKSYKNLTADTYGLRAREGKSLV